MANEGACVLFGRRGFEAEGKEALFRFVHPVDFVVRILCVSICGKAQQRRVEVLQGIRFCFSNPNALLLVRCQGVSSGISVDLHSSDWENPKTLDDRFLLKKRCWISCDSLRILMAD